MKTKTTRRKLFSRRAALLGALLFVGLLLGCLDADPLGPPSDEARLEVHVSTFLGGASGKAAAPDTLLVTLYDVTDAPGTGEPEGFPVAARGNAFPLQDDETGAYYLAELRVDLSDSRVFRVVTTLSYDGATGRERVEGERTVPLAPGDRKRVAMVLTEPGVPGGEEYALAVAKSVASPGAQNHAIPVILENGSPLGGIQFQITFDRSVLDSMIGIEVDPSSRLYAGSEGDSLIGSSYAQPTDSTLRVVTVDLRTSGGDGTYEPIRSIPPGRDLLFYLRVRLRDTFPVLPDTVNLSLEEVFFSTPSGSTDIVVNDVTGAPLIVTE